MFGTAKCVLLSKCPHFRVSRLEELHCTHNVLVQCTYTHALYTVYTYSVYTCTLYMYMYHSIQCTCTMYIHIYTEYTHIVCIHVHVHVHVYHSLFLPLSDDDHVSEDKDVSLFPLDLMSTKQFLLHLQSHDCAFTLQLTAR